jgi:hypothetical protein
MNLNGGIGMKDDYSDFIKKAYEDGLVKDVSDAFKEFSPEEEWHQGKIGNVVSESTVVYGSQYKTGDIVFIKEYQYLNGTEGRNHLFVIIERNCLIVPIENFCMLLSSKIDKVKYKSNVLLKKDELNHLKKDSIVKTDVIYNIPDDQILFKVGVVDSKKIELFKKMYCLNK